MEKEIIDSPSSLCRICFNTGYCKLNSHQIIIDEEPVDISDIFSEFSSLEVDYSDNIPSMLCSICLKELGESYLFLKKVRKADEQIKQLFDNTLTIEEEESNIDRNPAEYHSDYEYVVIDIKEENQGNNDITEPTSPKTEEEDETHSIVESIETEPETVEDPHIHQRIPNKRKRPIFVLTNNVSNILTKANQNLNEQIEEKDEDVEFICEITTDEPEIKKSKHEGRTFVVTKFVFVEPTVTPHSHNTETNCDDIGEHNPSAQQIRMLDIAAVEVDSPEDINCKLDEESNVENPNIIYMCKYCPKAYSTSLHLIMHARKSHVCQFCMQGFKKVDDLHRHTKTHTIFKCCICNKDFANNSNLRHHLKKCHELELPAHMSILEVKKKKCLPKFN